MFLYGLTEKKKNLRCEDEDKKELLNSNIVAIDSHTHIWHMDINFVDSNYEQ